MPQEVLDKIYNVDVTAKKANGKPKFQWGISMDFAIRNIKNGKILFGEIKRQDGWIETTNMQAGRGNAHERSCKYFTPGLMKVIREAGGLSDKMACNCRRYYERSPAKPRNSLLIPELHKKLLHVARYR